MLLPACGVTVCRNPTLREVWGCHSYSQKWDLTPKNSKRDCRGQNTSHRYVLYIVGKVLNCRCLKWPRTSHLDICSTSYGWKKGRESNWQFDSRSLKVRNQPNPGVRRWSVTHHWKALKESYKFALNLVLIGGWIEKVWMPKVSRVQTGTISGLQFGSFETRAVRMWVRRSNAENTIWGKVVASPEPETWWVKWVQGCSWLVPTPRVFRMWTNQLVG